MPKSTRQRIRGRIDEGRLMMDYSTHTSSNVVNTDARLDALEAIVQSQSVTIATLGRRVHDLKEEVGSHYVVEVNRSPGCDVSIDARPIPLSKTVALIVEHLGLRFESGTRTITKRVDEA